MRRTLKIAAIAAALLLVPFAAAAQTVPSGTSGQVPEYPLEIKNSNIWNMYQTYQTFLEEMAHSLSKGVVRLEPHDANRWYSYITDLRTYVAYWQSQVSLDLPVTHGRSWTVSNPIAPDCAFKSNLDVCELSAMLMDARDELVLSDSANRPKHLENADLLRQQSYWTAMEGFISYMLAKTPPVDEPITSAQEALGINPMVPSQ